MKLIFSVICFAVIAGLGCSEGDGAESDEPIRQKIAFEGEPQDRFAGTWKSADGVSTYKLNKDGSYELDSKIKVQGRGPIESHLKGEWRVQADRLLFRDQRGDVVPYAYSITGDTLELSLTGRLKSKTVLKRK
jgi:hypothetical protein